MMVKTPMLVAAIVILAAVTGVFVAFAASSASGLHILSDGKPHGVERSTDTETVWTLDPFRESAQGSVSAVEAEQGR